MVVPLVVGTSAHVSHLGKGFVLKETDRVSWPENARHRVQVRPTYPSGSPVWPII